LLWQKYVPLKVVVFVWRLLRNRLPTKDNLLRRGVLHTDTCQCVSGCGSTETVNHLFFPLLCFWDSLELYSPLDWSLYRNPAYCFRSLYSILFGWWRNSGVALNFKRHLVCYYVKNMGKRNNRIFNDKECPIMRIVDKIKSFSFSWLKEKYFQISLNYHGWWLSPLAMLCYG